MAGVPVVTRGAGAVAETVSGAALVLAAADPAYIAAALHRVCSDDRLRADSDRLGTSARSRAVGGRGSHPDRRRGQRSGGPVSPKVAFVTPPLRDPGDGRRRDGGAAVGRRAAGPHRLGVRGPHDLRPRPAHLGRRAGPGDHGGQRGPGAPPPWRARSAARLLRVGRARAGWRPGRRPWTRAGGGSTTTARSRRIWWPPSVRRTPTSSPSTPTCTTPRWRRSARSGRRPCCTRPRTTSPRCTCPCSGAPSGTRTPSVFHTASERRLVERIYPVAERPQIVLGLGVGESEGAGRPGGELAGPGGPAGYIVSVGGARRAQGLEDAGLVLRGLQGAPSRAPGPGPRRAGLGGACRPTPTSWSPGP